MLLFGGVTLHPTSLATTPSTDGSFFFRNKKQPTYYTVRSSSRRRSQQKHPTLLRWQSSNFGFFLLVFSWWHFCGVSFLPCFCLTHFFVCPFNPFDWFTAFEVLWIESIGEKKNTHFWQLFWPSMEGDFDQPDPISLFNIKGSQKIPSFLKSCQNWGPKKRYSV